MADAVKENIMREISIEKVSLNCGTGGRNCVLQHHILGGM